MGGVHTHSPTLLVKQEDAERRPREGENAPPGDRQPAPGAAAEQPLLLLRNPTSDLHRLWQPNLQAPRPHALQGMRHPRSGPGGAGVC